MRSRPRRALVLAVVLSVTGKAWAIVKPTVKVNATVIRLASDDKTQIPTLIVHGNQPGIGLKDCTDDTFIRFPLTVTGLPTSDSLQAWAGTGDCTQQGSTTTQTATCWPVHNGTITPTNTGFYVDIRVQDIVSQLYSTTKTLTYSPASSTVCQSAAAESTTTSSTTTTDAGNTTVASGETTVNVFFMWFPGGASTPESSADPYALRVKLVGPNAPVSVSAGVGDGLLVVNWTPPAAEADLQGFHLFSAPAAGGVDAALSVATVCNDAAQGTQLLDDAGNPVLDDAGNPIFVDDAGGAINPDAGCYEVYVPPSGGNQCSGTPTIDISTATSTVIGGAVNATGIVPNLVNGTTYVVAVAGYDSFQNDGPVSNAVCATPAPVDDFWKKYHEQGGGALGCALEPSGSGLGTSAIALALACGASLARRRKRAHRD